MDRELVSSSAKELTAKLEARYSISQPQVYKWLKCLKIQSVKQDGEVWVTKAQLEEMDSLNQFIKDGGKLEDYSSALATSETSELDYRIPTETVYAQQVVDDENIEEAAQTKAVGKILLQNLLIKKYIENPKLLSPELQEAIAESEAMANPKPIDPWQYAQEAFQFLQSA